MTPEQMARQRIDRQLDLGGWLVRDYRSTDLSVGLGVAAREFPLATVSADYVFSVDGKAIGVVEANLVGAHPDRRGNAVGKASGRIARRADKPTFTENECDRELGN